MHWLVRHQRLTLLTSFALAIGGLGLSSRQEAQSAAARVDEADAIVQTLVKSLTPEQKAKLIIPWDQTPKNLAPGMPYFRVETAKPIALRQFVRFTPGADREGMRLMELTDAQQALVEKYVDATMSVYGADQARRTMDQEARNKKSRKDYFVTLMGDPAGKYVFRLWEHHLTISTGKTESELEILPNLLGSHGGWEPKVTWVAEEKVAVELWKSLTDEQKKVHYVACETKSDQVPFPAAFQGELVEKLSPGQQAVTQRLFSERVRAYKPWMKARTDAIIKAHGGLGKLKLAFTGDASATCEEAGNRFAWKLTGSKFHMEFSSFPTAMKDRAKPEGNGTVGDEHTHATLIGELPAK